ncbi:hypothetical protein XENTR_v10010862 [Xenopus tropicalis]|nr:hypothetical protein XENTR_v10010862 [Xenopus tropicalis]
MQNTSLWSGTILNVIINSAPTLPISQICKHNIFGLLVRSQSLCCLYYHGAGFMEGFDVPLRLAAVTSYLMIGCRITVIILEILF